MSEDIDVRCSVAEKTDWEAAGDLAGMSVSEAAIDAYLDEAREYRIVAWEMDELAADAVKFAAKLTDWRSGGCPQIGWLGEEKLQAAARRLGEAYKAMWMAWQAVPEEMRQHLKPPGHIGMRT